MPASDPQIGEYWTRNSNGGVVGLIESVTETSVTVRTEASQAFEHVKADFVGTCSYLNLRVGAYWYHVRTGERRVITAVNGNFTVFHASDDWQGAPYDATPVGAFLATHRMAAEYGIDTSGFTDRPLAGFTRLVRPQAGEYWGQGERHTPDFRVWRVVAVRDDFVELVNSMEDRWSTDLATMRGLQRLPTFAPGQTCVNYESGQRRVITAVGDFTVTHAPPGTAGGLSEALHIADFLAEYHWNPIPAFMDPERQRERQRVMAAEDEAVFAALDNVAADPEMLTRQVPLSVLASRRGVLGGPPALGVAVDLQAHLDVDVMVEAFLARLSPLQREDLRRSGVAAITGLPEADQQTLHSNHEFLEGLLRAVRDRPATIELNPEPPRLCWDFLDDED